MTDTVLQKISKIYYFRFLFPLVAPNFSHLLIFASEEKKGKKVEIEKCQRTIEKCHTKVITRIRATQGKTQKTIQTEQNTSNTVASFDKYVKG